MAAVVGAYRTLCIAPSLEIRTVFQVIRDFSAWFTGSKPTAVFARETASNDQFPAIQHAPVQGYGQKDRRSQQR